MDMQKVGSFIRVCREELGFTQKELAESLNITDSAVSKWERGLSLPDTALIEPLAAVLRVSEGEILRGAKRKTLKNWLSDLRHFLPPLKLLGKSLIIWLAALLLMEPVELLISQRWLTGGGDIQGLYGTANIYNIAILAGYAAPSIVVGVWLSRKVYELRPYPNIGKKAFKVWMTYFLPVLAAAFALWYILFVVLYQIPVGLDWSFIQPHVDRVQTGINTYMTAHTWSNLPWFIITSFIYGEYCFRAMVLFFFYSLGVCRCLRAE